VALRFFVGEAGQRKLLGIVGTLGSPARFAGGLNRRQQKSRQNPNDGNHHE
jgi:hypothetical protein